MTARQLDAHVKALCKENEIARIVKPGRGRARVEARVIRHAPISMRDEMTYFVALHEVGHVLVGLKGYRLDREAACWRYAFETSLIQPHYSTRQRVTACLVRYLYRAKARGWKTPGPRSDFWRLMCWWQPAFFPDAAS